MYDNNTNATNPYKAPRMNTNTIGAYDPSQWMSPRVPNGYTGGMPPNQMPRFGYATAQPGGSAPNPYGATRRSATIYNDGKPVAYNVALGPDMVTRPQRPQRQPQTASTPSQRTRSWTYNSASNFKPIDTMRGLNDPSGLRERSRQLIISRYPGMADWWKEDMTIQDLAERSAQRWRARFGYGS